MKTLELDEKTEDYLLLTQAAELLRDDRWVPHFSGTQTEMCILQALSFVKYGGQNYFKHGLIPPLELSHLCQRRLENEDFSDFSEVKGFIPQLDSVVRYNDFVCKSGEEAATILEQAAELVLLRA